MEIIRLEEDFAMTECLSVFLLIIFLKYKEISMEQKLQQYITILRQYFMLILVLYNSILPRERAKLNDERTYICFRLV